MKLTRMRLEYVNPWPNHAGMFIARKKGWYADKGLDVDIVWDGWDRGTPVALANRGEFQFASVRLGELLETRQSSNPFVAVATFNQNQLGGVITVKSSGIRSFADLEGKTVSIPPAPRLTEMVREAMTVEGADYDKVNVQDPSPYEPDIRAVERGRYDAVFNVLGWESYQGSAPYDELVQLSFDEVGVTPHHAYFLCVRQQLLDEQPELVRDFVSATSRGYDFARDHQDESLQIMAPTMCNVEPEALSASLKYMSSTWHGPNGRWGEISEPLLYSYTKWMIDGGFCSASVDDIPGAWTNDFLPRA
ncbi:ABC transporter substrate-binding protein [Propionimicrobium sp. PCR01-08-3]|uniref:ABC transporter substrate-binding protein n=1 Tax=Propionimicrobium sp. PCR01-08-3 TaxID=3052086 RepID=UPI00255C7BA9|nr:ABC transporter substrate-binding protein [Propionimicrobium sp. PCR01-08-3]WIY83453.1 ABC transporter substrate-binding protein [Propionimicrobium sp. PCR01-08-3]